MLFTNDRIKYSDVDSRKNFFQGSDPFFLAGSSTLLLTHNNYEYNDGHTLRKEIFLLIHKILNNSKDINMTAN